MTRTATSSKSIKDQSTKLESNTTSGQIPQTAGRRLAKALPFPGNSATYEFGRNNLSLGSAFFQRGYFDQAEASFQLALHDDPSSAEAHYGLGSVYLKQDKLPEARASFEQALKLNASYPDTRPNAWNNLGLLATREGRTDDAISSFEEALRAESQPLDCARKSRQCVSPAEAVAGSA